MNTIDNRFALITLFDLVIAGAKVGMELPEFPASPENFNALDYPHFAMFVDRYLHCLYPVDELFLLERSASAIASLPDELIYETSQSNIDDLVCV